MQLHLNTSEYIQLDIIRVRKIDQNCEDAKFKIKQENLVGCYSVPVRYVSYVDVLSLTSLVYSEACEDAATPSLDACMDRAYSLQPRPDDCPATRHPVDLDAALGADVEVQT